MRFQVKKGGYYPATVYEFNLPAGHSCPYAEACKVKVDRDTGKMSMEYTDYKCYAAMAERFPGVRESRWRNFEALLNGEPIKVPDKAKHVRIHSSGDFFSQAYFDQWLEALGVACSEDGAIQVDERLETAAEGIYAVGDVKGGAQFTYISLDDSRIVWPELQKRLLDREAGNGAGEAVQASASTHASVDTRRIYPQTTFVDPPYSRVGLTEAEAREAHGDILVKASAAAQIPKTQVVEETAGRVKVILDSAGEQILGAQLFCYESHEVINLLALAIHEQIPAASLRDQIYNHPVMSEMFNELLS